MSSHSDQKEDREVKLQPLATASDRDMLADAHPPTDFKMNEWMEVRNKLFHSGNRVARDLAKEMNKIQHTYSEWFTVVGISGRKIGEIAMVLLAPEILGTQHEKINQALSDGKILAYQAQLLRTLQSDSNKVGHYLKDDFEPSHKPKVANAAFHIATFCVHFLPFSIARVEPNGSNLSNHSNTKENYGGPDGFAECGTQARGIALLEGLLLRIHHKSPIEGTVVFGLIHKQIYADSDAVFGLLGSIHDVVSICYWLGAFIPFAHIATICRTTGSNRTKKVQEVISQVRTALQQQKEEFAVVYSCTGPLGQPFKGFSKEMVSTFHFSSLGRHVTDTALHLINLSEGLKDRPQAIIDQTMGELRAGLQMPAKVSNINGASSYLGPYGSVFRLINLFDLALHFPQVQFDFQGNARYATAALCLRKELLLR